MTHSFTFAQRRKARHLIGRSLAGAALGAGLLTMPALADSTVTTTADSGTGSLRDAITDANADPAYDVLTFDPTALGTNADFVLDFALPSITGSVKFEMSGMSEVTVNQLLSIDGGSASVFGENLITDGIDTLNILSDLSLTNGDFTIGGGYGIAGDAQSIGFTGTVKVNDQSNFDLRGGNALTAHTGGNASVTGDVTISGESTFALSGGASTRENSTGGNASLTGNVIVDDSEFDLTGGVGYEDNGVGGAADLTGNVTLNNGSTFTLTGGRGLYGGTGGDASIEGTVALNDSALSVIGGQGGNDNGGFGDPYGNGGDASITGNVTLDNSEFNLTGGKGENQGTGGNASLTGDVTLSNESVLAIGGGYGMSDSVGGDAILTGDVTLNDISSLTMNTTSGSGDNGKAILTGNVTLNDESTFTAEARKGGINIIGDITANGTVDGNNGVTVIAGGGYGGNVSIIGNMDATNSDFKLNAGDGDDGDDSGHGGTGRSGGNVNITGNVNAINSEFIFNYYIVNGGGDGGSVEDGGTGGAGGNGGRVSITGNVDANNSDFYLATGSGGSGGDVNVGTGGSGGNGISANITGNVNATNNSYFKLSARKGGNGGDGYEGSGGTGGNGGNGGSASITGNVNATNSRFELQADKGGNGGDGEDGSTGGAGGNGGSASITGNVNVTDSQFELYAGTNGESGEDIDDGIGGAGGNGGNAIITGNVTANGESTFWLNSDTNDGEAGIVGDTIANDDSAFYLNFDEEYYDSINGAFIDGDATANDNSHYELAGNSYITGNAISNDKSTFVVSYGSHIDGDAIANGGEPFAFINSFSLTNGSYITGDAIANNYGSIQIGNYMSSGGDYVHGDAYANDHGRISVSGGRIDGDVIVHDRGSVNAAMSYMTSQNSIIGGSITVFDEGTVLLTGSSVGGNITGNYNSEISTYSLNSIAGDVTANGNSKFLFGGNTNVGGNVLLNDNSFFSVDGEISIAGDASFAPTTIYAPHVPLDVEPFSYGELLVDGTLQPGGATIVPWWNGFQDTFYTGRSYQIASANEIDGEFNPAVLSALPFDVSYENSNQDVILTISDDRPFDFARMLGTGNQKALATYLNGFVTKEPTNMDGAISEIIVHDLTNGAPLDLLNILIPRDYSAANSIVDLSSLTQFTGDTFTSFGAQSYWNQQSFIKSIADQLRHSNNMQRGADFALNATNVNDVSGQLHSLRQSMNASSHGLGFENGQSAPGGIWATVAVSRSTTESDPSVGSPEWSSSNKGGSVGYSSGGDSFRWGAAVGHQESDLSFGNRDGYGEMDGWNAGLYGAWKGQSAYLNTVLGYSSFDNDLTTDNSGSGQGQNGINTSSFDSHGISAYLELGKHLSEDKSGGFTPYASLLWTRNDHDGVQTNIGSGAPGAPTLTLRDGSQNTLTSALGIRYNHRMFGSDGGVNGGWTAGLAWLHQFKNTGFPVTGTYGDPLVPGAPTSFTVNGTPLSSNALQVQLGAYGRIHNSLVGFVNYRGTFSNDQKQNAVTAGLGYQF